MITVIRYHAVPDFLTRSVQVRSSQRRSLRLSYSLPGYSIRFDSFWLFHRLIHSGLYPSGLIRYGLFLRFGHPVIFCLYKSMLPAYLSPSGINPCFRLNNLIIFLKATIVKLRQQKCMLPTLPAIGIFIYNNCPLITGECFMVPAIVVLVIAAFYAYMVFETTWLKIERLDFSKKGKGLHHAPFRSACRYDQDPASRIRKVVKPRIQMSYCSPATT